MHCFPVSSGCYRSKSKLLFRKCGVHIGYGYGDAPALCAFDSPNSSGAAYKKFYIKIRALQPSEVKSANLQWMVFLPSHSYLMIASLLFSIVLTVALIVNHLA